MEGNNYYWANIYARVPDRATLIRIVGLSKKWIADLENIESYYILPRPEPQPIFRMRVASSAQVDVRRIEVSIVKRIIALLNQGVSIRGVAFSTAAEPLEAVRVDEALMKSVSEETPGLRRFTQIQCQFLRMLTDFVFELVDEGTSEEEYKRKARRLFAGDFFCLHLLSVALCLTPAEEGLTSLNYWKGFGSRRVPLVQVPL